MLSGTPSKKHTNNTSKITNKILNKTHKKRLKKILDSVEDEEMKNLLEKWIYKYTNVFNDELNEKAASVEPFKLELNENSNWEEAATNKAPPRWQMLAKQKEVHRFIKISSKAKTDTKKPSPIMESSTPHKET